MKTVFVILHYMTYEETKNCIDSIQNNIEGDYSIIVVDNGSTNDSGIRLKNEYDEHKNVKVIFTEKNLGFAKGNNWGYKYAKERLSPEFIVCLNNDTIIVQNDFLKILENIYQEKNFYVLGPDIIADEGRTHQNPSHKATISANRLKILIINKKLLLKELKASGISKTIYRYMSNLVGKVYRRTQNKAEIRAGKEDVILHGACLIFSHNYIDINDCAFYPKTFMYMEEDILHYFCQSNGWKEVYDDRIFIYHLEDVATNYVMKEDKERQIFKTENFLRSANILLDILDSNKRGHMYDD